MNFNNYNLEGMYASILKISNKEGTDEETYNPKDVSNEVLARVANPVKPAQAL